MRPGSDKAKALEKTDWLARTIPEVDIVEKEQHGRPLKKAFAYASIIV
jgi:hypothetical protein